MDSADSSAEAAAGALPDATPQALLEAFLVVHASRPAAPAALYARGELLLQRLSPAPPAVPAWGRFLVAMGHLAADHLNEPEAASRHFLAALRGAEHHGDHEAAVAAGHDQGVLQERRGALHLAALAYRAAASEGFRLGVIAPATLAAAAGAVRLHFQASGELDAEHRRLLKLAWLAWLAPGVAAETGIAAETGTAAAPNAVVEPDSAIELGRDLCAFLLPEDDPSALAERWRNWPPHQLPAGPVTWRDGDPACIVALYRAAADAATVHLADEGGDPAGPYRLLHAAARRTLG
ncbi:hypothetical protein LBMAG53_02330 [Planctomycetota bacterium]|nr:hypothetical protein LBMAG53_02330 [Planctomycetota bacterium]